jgi:hypothetical protein
MTAPIGFACEISLFCGNSDLFPHAICVGAQMGHNLTPVPPVPYPCPRFKAGSVVPPPPRLDGETEFSASAFLIKQELIFMAVNSFASWRPAEWKIPRCTSVPAAIQ